MRYLLVGNYGAGNLGDEALREYFLRAFPEVTWVVVTEGNKGNKGAKGNPSTSSHSGPEPSGPRAEQAKVKEVCRLPCGLRSLCTPWWGTLWYFWKSDGVVFGGGSLFTDSESVRACVLWAIHAFAAWCLGKPVYLAFQGVGPFRTAVGEAIARWVFDHAVFVSVRDHVSCERVKKWGVEHVIQSFDPVLTLLHAHTPGTPNSGTLLIVPRHNSSGEFWDRVSQMRCGQWTEVRVCEPQTLPVLCDELTRASFLLTQRYHAGIAALAFEVPFEVVPQVPGDKLDALQHEERDYLKLIERVRSGEEALRKALMRK